VSTWRRHDREPRGSRTVLGTRGGEIPPRDSLAALPPAEIYARDGVSLETSTLSCWVGATAAAFTPLGDALAAEIMRSDAPACRRHAGTGDGARQ